MFINPGTYFKRITDALENVVAPEIESDHVRGQVFAIVDLIRQIVDRIEFKQDLIAKDVDGVMSSITLMAGALREAGVDLTDTLKTFLEEFEEGKAGKGLALRNKTDEMFCEALDLFHDNLDKIGPEKAAVADAAIRDNMYKSIGRELGLMKPPMIEKISRSKREKK